MMKLKREICKSFNQHAHEYERAALVQQEIGQRLFERLDYLKIAPRYVLDLGCGTGVFTRLLKKKYPQAHVVACDIAFAMLQHTKKKQGWRRKWSLVNGDMLALPFADGVFDLVFANQVIHWASPLAAVLKEINRVMNQEACLMFSTLGADTFKELNHSWAQVDNFAHANTFMDMHDVGDNLLAQRFLDPVVDMEVLTVHYTSLKELLQSLKAQGVRNINQARNKGLTGKGARQAFAQAYQQFCTAEAKYPVTYEVVYGHAWKGMQRNTAEGFETVIPVSRISRQSK